MASTEPRALGDPDELEIGYWLSSEEHPPATLVNNASAAERTGFRTAMISDHFSPWLPQQGNSGYVWAVLGAIAATTSTLRVGTGVTAPVHRQHPLAIAHAAATVETMMPGRFFLGLGTGERLNEQVMGRRWPRPKERRDMVVEAIRIIRDLWSGKLVSCDDGHFRIERAQLATRPDVPPPIVVAAGGRKTAEIAGEHADGLLGVAPEADLVDAFEASGGKGKARLAQVSMCWAESMRAAEATVSKHWPNAAIPAPLLTELALPSDFAAIVEALPEDALTDGIPCGPDPEVHAGAIKRYIAAGFTTIYLHQIGPDQRGFLEFCERELLPRVGAARG